MRQTLAAIALLIVVDAGICRGNADIQDQINAVYHTPTEWEGLLVDSSYGAAQVVTTGKTGTLSRIELGIGKQFAATAPLHIDIVKVIESEPDFSESGRLTIRTIQASDVALIFQSPTFTTVVDFSAANLFFTSQERFAIVLRSSADWASGYGWWSNLGNIDTYSGGSAYRLTHTNGLAEDRSTDTQFRTFVAVPEPAMAVMTSAALVGLALARRSGRR